MVWFGLGLGFYFVLVCEESIAFYLKLHDGLQNEIGTIANSEVWDEVGEYTDETIDGEAAWNTEVRKNRNV